MIAAILVVIAVFGVLVYLFYPVKDAIPWNLGPSKDESWADVEHVNSNDPMSDKYTQRLLGEWQQHGKIIIGLDVDDTILPYKTATQKECDKVIDLVKECQAVGAHVILYTCRNQDGIQEALGYCKLKELHIDAVNSNPPGVELPYGSIAKPYANIFLDDRAGLRENLTRLAECMYRMRSVQYAERHDYPGALGW